jgi:DNA-binding CsgD family transcriptional regulator
MNVAELAVEELAKISELVGRIDYVREDADHATDLLRPVAAYLGAETASFRALSLALGVAKPHKVVSLGIPDSVNDAYVSRYHKLDPARRLLERRLTKPVFADPVRFGAWSRERMSPAALLRHRDEFARYRKHFLLPNHFVHHVGFGFQDLDGRTVIIDFHRKARSPAFSRLETVRAEVIAHFLQAKALRCRHVGSVSATDCDAQLSARELEVAEAVAIGLSNKEVAAALEISVRTVENHMRSIFAKLRVTTRTRLAAKLHEGTVKLVEPANRVA